MSKGSLSLWLKDYPLGRDQIKQLRDLSEIRIEKYSQTMRVKRETRLAQFYRQEKASHLPLSKQELFIAGLFPLLGRRNEKY